MSQFDVYRNRTGIDSDAVPFLVGLQNDLLSRLRTRVVAPLRRESADEDFIPRLNPRFNVEGIDVHLMMQELLYLPRSVLGDRVATLADHRDTIVHALDFLGVGF